MTFWDFCSPIYDFAQKRNVNYEQWNNAVVDCIDADSTVLELAGGTAEIAIRASRKARIVVCTDLSEKMLRVARKKARGLGNITFEIADLYDLRYADNSFDTVIASQVLHLLDNPQKALDELRRVAKKQIILPVCLLQNTQGFARLQINVWRLLGFNPKHTFDKASYLAFLERHGLEISYSTVIDGSMPIMVVVCNK
jgi:Methylase involved in ubiquinone/menaquinone biosynthesis